MVTRADIEIMAPVGSFESLTAAAQAGADAVYFGVEKLNMRARSSFNFTLDDLPHIAAFARKTKMRTYLTLNTVIYDHETEYVEQIISRAKEAGINAIIATDIAVIACARKHGVEIHMSTQVNITNIHSLQFYAQFADVMVLARELTLEQVNHIALKIKEKEIAGPSGKPVRLEMFVHGALCMAISGKCYLSLHEQNYSANRGQCMQTCRKAYTVTEKESGYELDIDHEYIMSPKDLCTIGFLDKLIEAGVRVLKIEGRARPPEYVRTVTECYNEAVKSICEGSYNAEKIRIWETRLSTVFNRGFWSGYYLGQHLGEWSKRYGSRATSVKIYTGRGTNYFSKLKVAEFLLEANSLRVGDEILITGPTTGVIQTHVTEIRLDEKPVEQAEKGSRISIPIDKKVRRADKLYKLIERTEKHSQ